MLRHGIAASLIVLGTGQIQPAAANPVSACGTDCAVRRISAPMLGERMEDSFAQLVVRGASRTDASGSLTERDRLKLYLLLTLRGGDRLAAPAAR